MVYFRGMVLACVRRQLTFWKFRLPRRLSLGSSHGLEGPVRSGLLPPTSPALAYVPSTGRPPQHAPHTSRASGPPRHLHIFASLLFCDIQGSARLWSEGVENCSCRLRRAASHVTGPVVACTPSCQRARGGVRPALVTGPVVACAPFCHESVMKTHGPRCPGWSPGAGITGFSICGAVSRWVLFPPQDSSSSLENATGALLVPWAGAWGSPARLGRTSPGLSTWRGRPVPGAGLGGRAGRRSSGCLDISSWLLACSSTPWGHSHLPSDC